MTYELAIGDRTYSSWSLRGWLLFSQFDIPVKTRTARLYTDELPQLLADYAPARLVPAMKHNGNVVFDTLAMAETMAENHPDKPFWPTDPAARAFARSIVAEMHSGFSALRGACPMNLRYQWVGFDPSAEVLADCMRVEQLWSLARAQFGADGPWLFGTYSIADVFYAPVATRFATYNLPRGDVANSYIETTLADPTFRRWRAMGLAQNHIQPTYDMGLDTTTWPGPAPLPARAVDSGPAQNAACPYSGKPVTDFLQLNGQVWGFCNPFCRDKTVADAGAFPEFIEMVGA